MKGRVPNPQSFGDIVEVLTKGSHAGPEALARVANSRKAALVQELRRYGEDSVASKVEVLPNTKVDSIHRRGMTISLSGHPILLSLCLAAVEEIEGASRPLARRRRKSVT